MYIRIYIYIYIYIYIPIQIWLYIRIYIRTYILYVRIYVGIVWSTAIYIHWVTGQLYICFYSSGTSPVIVNSTSLCNGQYTFNLNATCQEDSQLLVGNVSVVISCKCAQTM